MRKDLKALIDDNVRSASGSGTVDSVLDADSDEEMADACPRAMCVFWQEMMDDMKTKKKGVSGVREQFANFQKTQPG
jgi:hypothetical protein